ncbi:MAG: AraC family transcriptional regulator [Bacteroidota bacterium]
MVNIPDRLLDVPFVHVLHQSQHVVWLAKSLTTPIEQRVSYVRMHAISIPRKGTQLIEPHEGQMLRIPPGMLALVRKGLYTITDLLAEKQGFQSLHLFFDDHLLNRVLEQSSVDQSTDHPMSIRSFPCPNYLDHFMDSLDQLAHFKTGISSNLAQIKAMELLNVLISSSPAFLKGLQGLKDHSKMNLKAFMQANFDKALTVEDFANLTGRSLPTFRREFKLKFGTSPRKWIIQQRLEKAKNLLENQALPVGEVAQQVGYDNTSHFIKAFKSAFGHTPLQQRAQANDDF